jgi:hypothetical protein
MTLITKKCYSILTKKNYNEFEVSEFLKRKKSNYNGNANDKCLLDIDIDDEHAFLVIMYLLADVHQSQSLNSIWRKTYNFSIIYDNKFLTTMSPSIHTYSYHSRLVLSTQIIIARFSQVLRIQFSCCFCNIPTDFPPHECIYSLKLCTFCLRRLTWWWFWFCTRWDVHGGNRKADS